MERLISTVNLDFYDGKSSINTDSLVLVNCHTESNYFKALFEKYLVQHIVDENNKYGEQCK